MHNVFNSLNEMIGITPILKMNNLRQKLGLNANIYGKCEFYNPLFSIKDRSGLKIIEKANLG